MGTIRSHLTRGAWIEIVGLSRRRSNFYRRTSHEVRGLKSGDLEFDLVNPGCRTSHEVRGLKYHEYTGSSRPDASHLTRGAWIEIDISWLFLNIF